MRRPATQSKPAPMGGATTAMAPPRFPVWLIAALLALVTIALYWPATGHDFVNYDDPDYVIANPHVQGGLNWEGVKWAFGRVHGEQTYWHPLTWVSHMADCQLYGLKPWGHHLTSVLLHAANAVLVFLVFRRMTGAFGRCVVLAALFALHPLQVDSVAWVAERKNLLSAFFWLLTIGAYARYAQQPVVSNQCSVTSNQASGTRASNNGPQPADHGSLITDYRSLFYLLTLFFFALGLMCKPVLVTLPFVLLLLDCWPLGRITGCGMRNAEPGATGTAQGRTLPWRKLVWEKVPFLVLAAASSVITLLAHHALGTLGSVSRLPLDTRLENALVSYVRYLGKTVWPSRLAVFYPYPDAWPMWELVACGLLLLVISGLVLGTARSRPWLFVGWFWFLGVLVPFIGLVQAGIQAMADRFMYVPIIGVGLLLIWGADELTRRWRCQAIIAWAAAILVCLTVTHKQLGCWKDSEALFRHALEVTENNFFAHRILADALDEKGRSDEAISHYQEAIRLSPDYADYHYNFAVTLGKRGQIGEAISQYQEAIRLKPDYAEAHNNLGTAHYQQGHTGEAIRQFQEAIRLKPDYADAHNNLGAAFYRQGRAAEAIRQFQEALRLKPDCADARKNLDGALATQAPSPPQPGAPTNR